MNLLETADDFFTQGNLQEALKIYESLLQEEKNQSEIATLQNNIGLCYYSLENYDLAENYFKLFLQTLNNLPVPSWYDIAIANSNIGDAFSAKLEKEKAINYYKASLEIYLKNSDEIVEAMITQNTNIGHCLYHQNKYNEAESYYFSAKENAEKFYGTENERTNLCRFDLAENFYYQGKIKESFNEFAEVYYYFVDESNLVNKIDVLNHLTNLCFDLPADPIHENYFLQSVAECELVHGYENINTAIALKKLGRFYLKINDFKKACLSLEKVLLLFSKIKGEIHDETINVGTFLAEAYYKNKQYNKAKEISSYVLSVERSKQRNSDFALLYPVANLAFASFRCNDYTSAEKLFEEAILICEKAPEKYNNIKKEYKCFHIDSLIKLNDFAAASEKIKIYIDEENKLNKPDKAYLICLYSRMASCLIKIKNRMPEAEIYYRKCIELIAETEPDNIEKLSEEKLKLAALFKYKLQKYMKALEVLNDIRGNLIMQQMQNTLLFFKTQVEIAEISNINKSYEFTMSFLKPVYELSKDTSIINDKWRIQYFKEYGIAEFGLGNKENARKYLNKSRQLAINRYGKEIWIVPIIDKLLAEYFGEIITENDSADCLEQYNQFVKNELFSDAKKRNVRVFISSTFRDMMEERDYLMKNVFPEIRKTCKDYGIDFTEIDLRWGVTNEEAEQGKVIEICLNEIDKSRPYFIGILGERYGWIPDEKERSKIEKTLENFYWLHRDFDEKLSITEMEIQYGVLRNEKMEGNAFFYLRDKNLTPNQKDFFEKEDSPEHKKLLQLKNSLLKQEEYPVRDFNSVKELGDLIRNDLQKAIIRDSKLDRKLTEHEKFQVAQLNLMKQLDTFYVPPKNSLEKLNEFLISENNKMVIYSGQGNGKSALLSHWIREIYHSKNHTPVLFHFTGVYVKADTMNGLLWNISTTVAKIFNFENNYSSQNENYAGELEKILGNEHISQKLILVIDGVENFSHNSMFAKLYWLPKNFSEHVKLILSTNSEEYYRILKERDFDEIIPEVLETAQKRQFVTGYLQQFGKKLPETLVNKLAENKIADSPLSLKIILNEMRLMGKHEDIENELDKLLLSKTMVKLYEKVLERVENDFDKDLPGLTGNALSLISSSTLGLTEHEIMDLTGTARLYWAPIQNALEDYLTISDASISITDKNFRQAIKRRYLNNEKKIRVTREKLTRLLIKSSDNNRKATELAELLFHLDDKKGMADLLANVFVFKKIIFSGIETAIKCYNFVEKEYNLFELIKENIEKEKLSANITNLPEQLHWISSFFNFNLMLDEALFFAEEAYRIAVSVYGENHPASAKSLIDIGKFKIGLEQESNEILDVFLQAIKIIESENYSIGLDNVVAYTYVAQIYFSRNDFEKTREYAEKAMNILISRFGENNFGLVEVYLLLAKIDLQSGETENAESRVIKALDICAANTGTDSAYYQMAINLLIGIYEQNENKEAVIKLLKEQDKVYTDKFGKQHLITLTIKYKIASFYYQNDEIEKGEEVITGLLKMARFHVDEDSELMQGIIELQEYIKQRKDQISKREKEFDHFLEEKQKQIMQEIERINDAFKTEMENFDKNVQARQYNEALQNIKNGVQINTAINNTNLQTLNVAIINLNLGKMYYWSEDYKNGITYFSDALAIFIENNAFTEIAECLTFLADSFYFLEDFNNAISYRLQVVSIHENVSIEDEKKLAQIYYDLALDYYRNNQEDQSVLFAKKAFELRNQLFGINSEESDEARFLLGKAYYYQEFIYEARECFRATYAFRKIHFGLNSNEVEVLKDWLNKLGLNEE